MEISTLKQVQIKQMEIMDAIHRICEENGLKYYLIGGSCLGAIRHKGFIPWDVDIDIAMPREDYEKFFNLYYNSLPINYVVHSYKTDEWFAKSHAIVCLKNSKLLTKYDMLNPQIPSYGIFVDVMPLDKCPSDKKLQYKHKRDYQFVKKLRYYKISRVFPSNNWITKAFKYFLRFVFYPLSVRTINGWQQKVMMRYSSLESCDLWCSMASHFKYEKQLMDKSIYGCPVLVPFEDRFYYIPENADEYLRRLYNDYMKIPSKEEQNKMIEYFEFASWND